MQSKQQFCNLISRTISRAATAALAIATVFALTIVLTQSAQAQTLTVLHSFTGGGDGSTPRTGLAIDAAGNLYGTTWSGGVSKCEACGYGAVGCGTVFKLKHSGSAWVLNTLYGFTAGNDGACPQTRPALAEDGTLYGTTTAGGGNCSQLTVGCGTVFHLKPSPTAPKTALAPWSETLLHTFTGSPDGVFPEGDLTFDPSGNIYGTTFYGGNQGQCGPIGCGTVYELTPSGGGWTETILYAPPGLGPVGITPEGGVVLDKSGNAYGVFSGGGPSGAVCANGGCGTVYKLSPFGSGWTPQVLYAFTSYYGTDGSFPDSVILDPAGNLYGTTYLSDSGGTVFELAPVNGGWTFTTLHDFYMGADPDPAGPADRLLRDAAGNLYGTTAGDGHGYGNVFKLTPSSGGWTYTDLYDFTGGSDGWYPEGGVVMDAKGNLYGTTSAGGAYGYGVVWEIAP